MSDKKTSKDAERDLLAPVSFDEFEKPTYEQWQAEVEKALKVATSTRRCSLKPMKVLRCSQFTHLHCMEKKFQKVYILGQASSYVALRQVVILKSLGAYPST